LRNSRQCDIHWAEADSDESVAAFPPNLWHGAVPVAVHAAHLQASPDELKAAILLFYGLLDEQQRRLFAGLESIRLGHGGDTLLGDFLGLDVHTAARARQQLLDQNVVSGRSRRTGEGRTPAEKKRPT
jgi:hypothetical protein